LRGATAKRHHPRRWATAHPPAAVGAAGHRAEPLAVRLVGR
nr:hypothetical protein [Tanacetum cinerariifolium]